LSIQSGEEYGVLKEVKDHERIEASSQAEEKCKEKDKLGWTPTGCWTSEGFRLRSISELAQESRCCDVHRYRSQQALGARYEAKHPGCDDCLQFDRAIARKLRRAILPTRHFAAADELDVLLPRLSSSRGGHKVVQRGLRLNFEPNPFGARQISPKTPMWAALARTGK
jgi:hypothetical protein